MIHYFIRVCSEYTSFFPFVSEPGYPSQPEPSSTQSASVSDEKEQVKPQAIPATETPAPFYQLEQHYPVVVMKTEDAPLTAHVPVLIPEEKPAIQQTATGSEMPVLREEPGYQPQRADVDVADQQVEVHNVDEGDQAHIIVYSQEERDNEDLPEPGNASEQMHEPAQEDISETPVTEQQVIAPELKDNLPAQVSWTQETTPVGVQETDEFYISEEQDIPQANSAYAGEYREESHDGDILVSSETREPWVMVDYPPAEEVKENRFLPQDNLSAPEHVQMETTNDQLMQEIQQPQMLEEAEREYHNDVEGVENEEVDETPVVEVHCTCMNL